MRKYDDGQVFTRVRLYLSVPVDVVEHSLKTEGNVIRVVMTRTDAATDPMADALEGEGADPLADALAGDEEVDALGEALSEVDADSTDESEFAVEELTEEELTEEELTEEELTEEELTEEELTEEELTEEELFEVEDSQLGAIEEDLDVESIADADLGEEDLEIAAESVEEDPLLSAIEASSDMTVTALDDREDSMQAALAGSDAGNGTWIETEQGERRLSGPEDIEESIAVTSLDFQMLDNVARVIIGVKGAEDIQHQLKNENLIVVDVPDAFLPQSLNNTGQNAGRFLNTEKFLRFGSPIKKVRAYRTSKGARIAIASPDGKGGRGRSLADYRFKNLGNGLVYIDIPLTAQEQESWLECSGEGVAEVAPQDSDSGIENAYRKEVLIGKGGRTIDPQSAFGTGGGSSSPSMLPGMVGGFITEVSGASAQSYMGERINLDFMNADIHGIFRLISTYSKWNIVAGDDVQGKVTVQMHDVPWDQAFQAILQSKGLGAQKFGNVVRVAPIETIKSEQQAALDAKRAQEELAELQMQVLPLNYTTAAQMQSQIQDLISERGSVQVDTSGNQLIIQETEERIAQIRELVRQLDKATPQVLIEARVVEASSNFTKSLGIEWGAELNASTETGYSTGLFFPNSVGVAGGMDRAGGGQFYSAGQENLLVDLGASGSTGSVAFSLGSIPGLVDLDARLSAMEADGWGKVVSKPRITTLDNKSAQIQQGQKIPFLSTSSGGTRVQFIEATLNLSVTPHITSDDKVYLTVQISNNRADFSQLVQGQPAIQIKQVSTEMLVADGDTTVMGGVFSTEESYSQDRVPGLSKIPLLGYLFKNSAEAVTRNELLVFITPHVVTKASIADSG